MLRPKRVIEKTPVSRLEYLTRETLISDKEGFCTTPCVFGVDIDKMVEKVASGLKKEGKELHTTSNGKHLVIYAPKKKTFKIY